MIDALIVQKNTCACDGSTAINSLYTAVVSGFAGWARLLEMIYKVSSLYSWFSRCGEKKQMSFYERTKREEHRAPASVLNAFAQFGDNGLDDSFDGWEPQHRCSTQVHNENRFMRMCAGTVRVKHNIHLVSTDFVVYLAKVCKGM